MHFNIIDQINIFSDVTYQGQQSIASHFGCLSGRSVSVVKSKTEENGYRSEERSWDWLEMTGRVALFALECITVVPAVVFTVMKLTEQSALKQKLHGLSEQWADRSDALGDLLQFVEKTAWIPEKVPFQKELVNLRNAFSSNHAAFKELLPKIKERVRGLLNHPEITSTQKEQLCKFFKLFTKNEDRIFLVAEGQKIAISHDLARVASQYFTGNDRIAPATKEFPLQARAASASLIADYITNKNLSGIDESNATEIFGLADYLGIPEVKNRARSLILNSSFQSMSIQEVYELWKWANTFNDDGIKLRTLVAFSHMPQEAIVQVSKGRRYEFSQILDSAQALSILKAEVSFDETSGIQLSIGLANTNALKALAPIIARGVDTLSFAQCHQISPAIACLPELLAGNSKIRSLSFERDFAKLGNTYSVLEERDIQVLAACLPESHLTRLNLSGNQLAGEKLRRVFRKITPESTLRQLHLAANHLNQHSLLDLQALPIFPNLEELDLSGESFRELTDAFKVALASHQSLSRLITHFHSNNYDFLRQNTSLKELVCKCYSDSSADTYDLLFAAIRDNQRLEQVQLRFNGNYTHQNLQEGIVTTLRATAALKIALNLPKAAENRYNYYTENFYAPITKEFPGRFILTNT